MDTYILSTYIYAVTYTSDFAPVLSKEFLDIQATIECGFILKHVRDTIRTYNLCLYFLLIKHSGFENFLFFKKSITIKSRFLRTLKERYFLLTIKMIQKFQQFKHLN